MHHRETLLWNELDKIGHPLICWSSFYKVSPSLVASILYVEMQQYSLFNVGNVLRRLKLGLTTLSFTHAPGNLAMRMNLSLGVAHIKPMTISRATRFVQMRFGEPLDTYAQDPNIAIRYICGILRAFISQWAPDVDLTHRPEILATLYNISDFGNKFPHPNPQVGGFIAPLFVDGFLTRNLCFGARVALVQTSEFMRLFSLHLGFPLDFASGERILEP